MDTQTSYKLLPIFFCTWDTCAREREHLGTTWHQDGDNQSGTLSLQSAGTSQRCEALNTVTFSHLFFFSPSFFGNFKFKPPKKGGDLEKQGLPNDSWSILWILWHRSCFKLILQLLAGGLRHNICFPFVFRRICLGQLLYSISICVTWLKQKSTLIRCCFFRDLLYFLKKALKLTCNFMNAPEKTAPTKSPLQRPDKRVPWNSRLDVSWRRWKMHVLVGGPQHILKVPRSWFDIDQEGPFLDPWSWRGLGGQKQSHEKLSFWWGKK